MDEKPSELLTIEELSAYRKVPRSTLYKLVRDGKIPSQKVGRHWRFRKKPSTGGWTKSWRKNRNSKDKSSEKNQAKQTVPLSGTAVRLRERRLQRSQQTSVSPGGRPPSL